MNTRSGCSHSLILSCLLGLGAIGIAGASAQEVLQVYGSEGPFPAIHEAAIAFGDKYGITVEVVSGPTSKWLQKAKNDADVIFSSAEFMMSEFIRTGELEVDPVSVTPLYLRPSAILVRPGNPKGIRDFPDLLRQGVRVMVVCGSGQTGLWEDMAAKQGDIRTIRAFRKNIVFFAPSSETAMRTWGERPDIDVWVTWNIWHMPLHDRADHVPVSEDYRIYRQCNAALTQRGKSKPLAAKFIEFLTSPEGAEIFESWEWMTPPHHENPLTVRRDIAIVCCVDSDTWKNKVGSGLTHVRELVEAYRSIGTPLSELHISAVLHGDAGYWVLKDKPYAAFTKKSVANPNKSIIRELNELGISVEVCGETMSDHGWTQVDLLPGVKTIASAYPRIADLQLQGYAYLRF